MSKRRERHHNAVMPEPRRRFGDFLLDVSNRRLLRSDEVVALNARYFDALVLLVREQGRLVSKQRLFEEVWAGSVVSDAALTQCIKEIRRQLGDDAGNPRFIRTVPGHGYCFFAPVWPDPEIEAAETPVLSAAPVLATAPPAVMAPSARDGTARRAALSAEVSAAAAGGALAGLLGGVLYGSILALAPQGQGLGTLSVLLVMVALSVAVGLAGAACVGLGMSAGRRFGGSAAWTLAGATAGGWTVGGLTRLLGADAFTLLVGQAPTGITGGLEGAVIGFAVAAGLLLGDRFGDRRAAESGGDPDAAPKSRLTPEADAFRMIRPAVAGALSTALAGALLSLAGGSLMASSLAGIASTFSGSRLDITPLARLLGQAEFSTWAQAGLGALEGGLFGGCVVASVLLARHGRHIGSQPHTRGEQD